MTAGKYEEKLPCGGTLRVTAASWEIGYYFPGPDLRHNGTFFNVPGSLVDEYIEAFETNLEEFEKLKQVIPAGGDFSKPGLRGMSIRLGSFSPGVCLRSYHMPLTSSTQVKRVTDGYLYAKRRAPEIQRFLASL